MPCRILIASDLHAHAGNPNSAKAPSLLSTDDAYKKPNVHPINGAIELVKAENIQADWVLCPGDLCDQANHSAQSEAWASLEALKKAVHARRLIGTIGNHDLDSRNSGPITTLQQPLKALSPQFPISDMRPCNSFWKEGFAVYCDAKAGSRLVIVDSCYFHAIPDPIKRSEEFRHGRISEETISKLAHALQKSSHDTNILIMHHHIRQHPFSPEDQSEAHNAALLLEILRDTGMQWFVIHGHQHVPSLSYCEGSVLSPVVFSAGSVAARTWARRGITARNQLYLVEIEDVSTALPELRGKLFAWDWTPYVGWSKATDASGLPWKAGFGCRGVGRLVGEIAALVASCDPPRMKWSGVETAIPECGFLIPADRKALVQQLRTSGFEIWYDEFQVPAQIEMAP